MAPRDDDRVMAGMLRRNLARSPSSNASAAGNECPPADILAAYYERSLGEDEAARYDMHFSNCVSCREQLAAMVRAELAPQTKSSWAWLWNPYVLAPAVAVLALAVFFGVHRSSQNASVNQPSNAPLVAMSRGEQLSPQEEPAPKPVLPNTASGSSSSNQVQTAPSDSAERDSLSKVKQLASPAPPVPPSAPAAAMEPAPSPVLSNKKVQDVPLNGRNIVQLQQSADATSKAQSASPAQPNSQSAQAVITSASPVIMDQNAAALPQAHVPSASPRAGGGTASASAPSTTAETVNRAQTQAPAAMSRFAGIARAPSPQVTAEISTQKVFQTPNSNVLWRSADGGFVERSSDGGATWQGQPLPGLGGEISAGSSPTTKICWLVGSGGSIFMTKDAANWKKIAPPVSADFVDVAANDASNATVTAADGRRFQTADGGKHWKPLL